MALLSTDTVTPSENEALSRLQDGFNRTVTDLNLRLIPWPDGGQLISDVTLAVGTNVIEHKLGRTLQGWLPLRVRASGAPPTENPTPANSLDFFLELIASTTTTLDLWVY